MRITMPELNAEKLFPIWQQQLVYPPLEMQLMDGILHTFHEQTSDDTGQRAKNYFSQICDIIQWRLNNKSTRVRQQAADLISRIALVMKNCGEETKNKLNFYLNSINDHEIYTSMEQQR